MITSDRDIITATQPANRHTRKRKATQKPRQAKPKPAALPSAYAVLIVALAALAVSLCHLAGGISHAAGLPTWQGWALALSLDAGLVTLEWLTATRARLGRRHDWPTTAAIVTIAGFSMAMNAIEMSGGAYPAIGIALGLAIPVLLLASTRAGIRTLLGK